MSAINDLLTQQPGKLKIRDLKKAIEDQKEAQKRKVEEQQALRLAQVFLFFLKHEKVINISWMVFIYKSFFFFLNVLYFLS